MIRLKLNLLLLFISSLFTNSESFDGMFLLDCHHFPHYTVHFFILWDLSNSAFQPIDPLIPSTFPHFVVRRTTCNPLWHELWKQEKCSSLAPPRAQWTQQGVKLTRLMSIVTSKKVWNFLIKIQQKKSNPKKTRR